MLYLLSVYQPDGPVPEREVLAQIGHDLDAVNTELRVSGAWVFAGGLFAPSTATVVRHQGHETLITDGPYIEGKEHLGGITIIEAADLDAALDWARKLSAAATLPIEVRPFADGSPG